MGADKPNGMVSYNRRPPQRPLLQKIQYTIWNPEEKTFLGRTAKRWGIIGLIYLVMYICILVFFSICMCGLLAIMDEKVPYFTLTDSIIGKNPGMGHRPIVFEEGALIWYKPTNVTQVKKYVDNINEFLALNMGVNQQECGGVRPPREDVCAFNLTQLGPCSKKNNFGYADGTPCIIIKLNRLYAWHPDFYDDPGDLPLDMPTDILEYINATTTTQERRKIWLSCKGERPGDVEAIGPLKYWPYPGLSEVYYPYDNTPGYLSPIVAVQLLKPRPHQIINIRCRAWARNIEYTDSLKDRLGSTHIEIMID